MSSRVAAVWRASPEAYGPRSHRRPCSYEAYVPDLLTDRDLSLPAHVAADVSDAEQALVAVDRSPRAERLSSLARFLLRAEAIGSSTIEGLQVSPRRLAQHEAKSVAGWPSQDGTAAAVLGNVASMRLAVDELAAQPEFTTDDLRRLHHRLLRDEMPAIAGVVRARQNWIGGNGWNPCQAAFVPPPPDRLEGLLKDLCAFITADATTPLLQAAVAHAQFETIHPFADGNGRAGRALIHVVLRRRGLVRTVVPPISPVLALVVDTYVGGLQAFRYDGPAAGEQAQAGLARWVETFAAATRRAAADAASLAVALEELEARWVEQVRPRRGSAAARLLRELPALPVLSATDAQKLTGASRSAAFTAVEQLVHAHVLRPVSSRRTDRLFEAPDVFAVLTDHERAAATEGGDTRLERPARPVPARARRVRADEGPAA